MNKSNKSRPFWAAIKRAYEFIFKVPNSEPNHEICDDLVRVHDELRARGDEKKADAVLYAYKITMLENNYWFRNRDLAPTLSRISITVSVFALGLSIIVMLARLMG